MKPTSFKIDTTTAEQLEALGNLRQLPKSAVVRHLIRQAYLHEIERVPHCASGFPCLMPALFAQNQAALEQAANARALKAGQHDGGPRFQEVI